MFVSFFTGSWGRNFVDRLVREKGGGGLKGKITLRKLILFETSYLSLQWLLKSLNNDDAGIAAQVDLKTSKPLHANWVINTHNVILNAQN